MHSYPTSHVKTSQNLDKRFIFCLTGGEEMIHLAHYCGSGSANIRLESPCKSCWGLQCRPRLSRPASAPCCQAAPPQWPRCCSTHSSDISWIKKKSSWWKSRSFLYLGEGILLPVPAQYQPFSMAGCRSSLSHPLVRQSVNHLIIFIRQELHLPEVTLSAPGPDVGHLLLPQHALHPVVLGPRLDADGIHAKLPTQNNY